MLACILKFLNSRLIWKWSSSLHVLDRCGHDQDHLYCKSRLIAFDPESNLRSMIYHNMVWLSYGKLTPPVEVVLDLSTFLCSFEFPSVYGTDWRGSLDYTIQALFCSLQRSIHSLDLFSIHPINVTGNVFHFLVKDSRCTAHYLT